MRRLWLAVVLVVTLSMSLRAQSVDDAKKAFADSVVKQRFILRGLSGGAVVQYAWIDDTLTMHEPLFSVFGFFQVESISYKLNQIEITGKRVILVKAGPKGTDESTESPAILRIDLGDADLSKVLPQLKHRLFYATTEEALVDVPKEYRAFFPFDARRPDASVMGPDAVRQVCRDLFPGTKLKPPKLVKMVNPIYPKEAKDKNYVGNVLIRILVDDTGRISAPWVLYPAAFGMDESAVIAVKQYQLEPARCNANPVPTMLTIEVNFQVYY